MQMTDITAHGSCATTWLTSLNTLRHLTDVRGEQSNTLTLCLCSSVPPFPLYLLFPCSPLFRCASVPLSYCVSSTRYRTLSKWPWLTASWSPLQETLMYVALLNGKKKHTSPQKRPPNSSVVQRLRIPLGLFHCLYGVSTLLLSKKDISTPSQNASCGTFMENASQLLNPPQCLRSKNKIWPKLPSKKYKIGFAALRFLTWQ